MKKLIKWAFYLWLLAMLLDLGGVIGDRQMLHDQMIRLHVVGASDSKEDQAVKLQVRDAVVEYVDMALSHVMTLEEAKAYLQEHLPEIEAAANAVLAKLGLRDKAAVSFTQEAFPSRVYDTFSLPSGVYQSLRVTIGEGQGRNWWCVVFPGLCFGATAGEVEDIAAGAGFSDDLTNTLTRQEGYRVRFFLLDVLGKVENFFFG